MARRVYFSFHYDDVRDFRANVVRNSGRFKDYETAFIDRSIWEKEKRKNAKVIKALIDQNLHGISVNCVLIGSQTYSREWVRYEIVKSLAMGKGQFGVHINWINDKYGRFKLIPGDNPFGYIRCQVSKDGYFIDVYEYDRKSLFGSWKQFDKIARFRNMQFGESYFGSRFPLSEIYSTYSYVWDDGFNNISKWVERAAEEAGR